MLSQVTVPPPIHHRASQEELPPAIDCRAFADSELCKVLYKHSECHTTEHGMLIADALTNAARHAVVPNHSERPTSTLDFPSLSFTTRWCARYYA